MDEIDSTNDYAHNLIKKSATSDFCNKVVVADFQTAGRGAFQNAWESAKCQNLTFSVIICPKIEANRQFFLSKITSLAIFDFFKSHKLSPKIKWPNDIFVNNKKISGILIENKIQGHIINYSVVGIGININQTEFYGNFSATSLALEKNDFFDLNKELQVFLNYFDKWKFYFCKKNTNFITSEYERNLLGIDEFLRYRDKNEAFFAKIKQIDQFGRIVLIDENEQIRKYNFKEVEMLHNL